LSTGIFFSEGSILQERRRASRITGAGEEANRKGYDKNPRGFEKAKAKLPGDFARPNEVAQVNRLYRIAQTLATVLFRKAGALIAMNT
jgi:hypothetical protein